MQAQKGLVRIASLYAMLERMRSVEVLIANGAVEDVLCAEAIAATIRENQIADGRDALARECREDWQVAETTLRVIDLRIDRLQQVRAEREADLAEAARALRASRLEMEQMERIVEKTRLQARLEESRRTQATADDRFASRSIWMERRQVRDNE